MNINLDLSNLQEIINPAFFGLLSDTNRFLILRGGAGSGKSHALCQKILLRDIVGMKQGIKHKFLCLRKTAPAARKSLFALFQEYIDAWNLEELYKVNKTDMTISNPFSKTEILIGGMDDPEKIKSIEGVTTVWLEESNEFTLDDFRQIGLRLRGKSKTYYQIMLSFNPVSKNTWIYDEFFSGDTLPKDTTLHFSTYKDNVFLDQEYKDTLEGLVNKDKYFYQVYCLGEWGEVGNLIYTNYKVIDPIEMPQVYDDYFYGLDFGYNEPAACVMVGLKDNNVYLEEMLYKRELTNFQLSMQLDSLVERNAKMYCDNAEPDRIQELKQAGYRAVACSKGRKAKGKTMRQVSIDFVRRQKLFIPSDSLNLLKEIRGYKYKTTTDGEVLEDPVEFMDHCMDAVRYAIWTHIGNKRSHKAIWL